MSFFAIPQNGYLGFLKLRAPTLFRKVGNAKKGGFIQLPAVGPGEVKPVNLQKTFSSMKLGKLC